MFWIKQHNGQMAMVELKIKRKVTVFWEENEEERPLKGWKVKTEAGLICSVRKRPKKFASLDLALKWVKQNGFSEAMIYGPDYKATLKFSS